MTVALVIGAGPAGLMAAERLAGAGVPVVVAEAKASAGRKLLMAGKSGLNLTKAGPVASVLPHYAEAADWLAPMLTAFGPDAVQDWARGLGVPVFTGSTGRVFPVAMKASPLLRAWLARLGDQGVTLRTRWRWTGFAGEGLAGGYGAGDGLEGRGLAGERLAVGGLAFDTPDGPQVLRPAVTVLALGGASWARLGSDGAWVPWLAGQGVVIAPFRPANIGFRVDWSPQMARQFGAPVKGAALIAGGQRERGEFVISAQGIEGGGVYAISRAVRDGAALALDLLPDWTVAQIAARLSAPGKDSLPNLLRKAVHLDPVRVALLMEFGRPLPAPAALAPLLKSLFVRHHGPRPLDEAISTAGGIPRAALTAGLELCALPGIFAAGEMLDWEAPTGGYLLTACLATGRWAGDHAAARYRERTGD